MTCRLGKNKDISFYEHQTKAVSKLRTGSILCGGVGSGKTLTSLLYFYEKECGGIFTDDEVDRMTDPKDLYVITTARKRDTLDWEKEAAIFAISTDRDCSIDGVKLVVDSWNNIKKYIDIERAFFIFDEQRVVGSGAWVKSFLKITKKNNWILLTATPGDTWMDYIPVFVANGLYKNRTAFIRQHVVYNRFLAFPKIERFINTNHLERLKSYITVNMDYKKQTTREHQDIWVSYDKEKLKLVRKKRWDPYANAPLTNPSQLFYTVRKVVNSDPSRIEAIKKLLRKHPRLIIFYNFDYELEILRTLKEDDNLSVAEYNGHKHEDVPDTTRWAYLVQYMSGGEGWNCITTNAIAFYSQNYSYRMTTQAAGRIDRLNTPYDTLHYYHILSRSFIDLAIRRALRNKKKFNERSIKI